MEGAAPAAPLLLGSSAQLGQFRAQRCVLGSELFRAVVGSRP
jgi:hypothetical protein